MYALIYANLDRSLEDPLILVSVGVLEIIYPPQIMKNNLSFGDVKSYTWDFFTVWRVGALDPLIFQWPFV